MELNSQEETLAHALERRQVLLGASALGLSSLLAPLPAMAQSAPKKGGTLRLGMTGGSASDSMNPRTYGDRIAIAVSLLFYNQLVEIDETGNAKPELAESWESKAGATNSYLQDDCQMGRQNQKNVTRSCSLGARKYFTRCKKNMFIEDQIEGRGTPHGSKFTSNRNINNIENIEKNDMWPELKRYVEAVYSASKLSI